MSEYRYILTRYKDYQNYTKKIIIFSAVMLVIATSLTVLNFIRISPLIFYLLAMALTLFYASRNHAESKNFTNLKKFIGSYNPKNLNNEERLFFIDYQLNAYFGTEATELFSHLNDKVKWNDVKAIANLKLIIAKIEDYYAFLNEKNDLQENIDISLAVYTSSFEKKKKDLV